MIRTVLAATVALALGSTLYLAAQQPAPPAPGAPGAAPAGRAGGRGFGPPGGGPEDGLNQRPPNAPDQKPAVAGQYRAPEQKLNVAFNIVTVTEGLVNPWSLTWLPDGRMLVTERPGRLRIISADGKTMSEPVAGLPMVDSRGQGGLLDVSLDPAFQKNQLIYWSYAANSSTVQHRRSRTCR
jgi:glucose/arabinose dehydrogenase